MHGDRSESQPYIQGGRGSLARSSRGSSFEAAGGHVLVCARRQAPSLRFVCQKWCFNSSLDWPRIFLIKEPCPVWVKKPWHLTVSWNKNDMIMMALMILNNSTPVHAWFTVCVRLIAKKKNQKSIQTGMNEPWWMMSQGKILNCHVTLRSWVMHALDGSPRTWSIIDWKQDFIKIACTCTDLWGQLSRQRLRLTEFFFFKKDCL